MSYGDGSIYKRGASYAGQFYFEGRPYSVYGATKTEVREKIRERRAALAAGRDLPRGRETLGAYLPWWLANVKAPTLSPVTVSNYATVLGLLPSDITRLRLEAIKPEHVEEAVAGMSRHYARNTVRNARRLLKSALDYAVNSGRVPRNPADVGTGPGTDTGEHTIPAFGDLLAFVEQTRDTRWYPLWVMLVYTGMRIGEALALEWPDIDGDLLSITKSTHYDGANRWVGKTKTPKSVRTLSVAPAIHEALPLQKIQRGKDELRSKGWMPNERIFSQPRDGKIMLTSTIDKALLRACAVHGFPVMTPHGFRHAYATHGARIGVHPNDMQRILGHSDVSVTLRYYTHLDDDTAREAMRRIGASSSRLA